MYLIFVTDNRTNKLIYSNAFNLYDFENEDHFLSCIDCIFYKFGDTVYSENYNVVVWAGLDRYILNGYHLIYTNA